MLKQLSAMGEIKLGTLKGQDEHGNMYYECLKYQFGEAFCFTYHVYRKT